MPPEKIRVRSPQVRELSARRGLSRVREASPIVSPEDLPQFPPLACSPRAPARLPPLPEPALAPRSAGHAGRGPPVPLVPPPAASLPSQPGEVAAAPGARGAVGAGRERPELEV